MKWEESDGFLTAHLATGESIEKAMEGICRVLAKEVIPRNAGIVWDYLRVELWTDSGRLVFFPALKGHNNRIEKVGCQVVFAELLAYCEELSESAISDDEFDNRLLTEEHNWIAQFLEAATHTSVLGRLHIVFRSCDDEPPIQDVTIGPH